jgi:phage terminase Nu1 subunit (DNA packaging protein)
MNLLTRRELATVLDVHVMTIVKWDRSGMPVAERGRKGKPSRYSEVDVRAWLAAREEAAKQPGAPLDVAQERARKEHWQALLAEQKHKVLARELIPAAEVERVWGAERDAIRTSLLALPTHAARVARVSTLEGEVGVERELKAIAHEILRELAGEQAPPGKRKGRAA